MAQVDDKEITRIIIFGRWSADALYRIVQSRGIPIQSVKSRGPQKNEVIFKQALSQEAVDMIYRDIVPFFSK